MPLDGRALACQVEIFYIFIMPGMLDMPATLLLSTYFATTTKLAFSILSSDIINFFENAPQIYNLVAMRKLHI